MSASGDGDSDEFDDTLPKVDTYGTPIGMGDDDTLGKTATTDLEAYEDQEIPEGCYVNRELYICPNGRLADNDGNLIPEIVSAWMLAANENNTAGTSGIFKGLGPSFSNWSWNELGEETRDSLAAKLQAIEEGTVDKRRAEEAEEEKERKQAEERRAELTLVSREKAFADSLAAWNPEDDVARQQLEAKDDDFAAQEVDVRLAWCAVDTRALSHRYTDGEANRQINKKHVQFLAENMKHTFQRVRGDLPKLTMLNDVFEECVAYTAGVYNMSVDDARRWAQDPDAWRQEHKGDGVARSFKTDLFKLLIPKAIKDDPARAPQLQGGHHRTEAGQLFGRNRNARGNELWASGSTDNAADRDLIFELFGYGVYILDQGKVYSPENIGLKRYVRANRTIIAQDNSEGDTFRNVRQAWEQLDAAKRKLILDAHDPAFPHGFPSWVQYATGTTFTDKDDQARMKRVLVSITWSAIADSWCRLLFGRASFNTTRWADLMSSKMDSYVRKLFNQGLSYHANVFGVDALIVTEDDLTMINSTYEFKEHAYDNDALLKLFFPSKADKAPAALDHPTPEEWTTLMKTKNVPNTSTHPGRVHRHPRLLADFSLPAYEEAFRLLLIRKGPALISGAFMSNFAKTHLVILRAFLHFIFWLYDPQGYLPTSNASKVEREFDLAQVLRPLAFPTDWDTDSDLLDDDEDGDPERRDKDIKRSENSMFHAINHLLWHIRMGSVDWKVGEKAAEKMLAVKDEWRTLNFCHDQAAQKEVFEMLWKNSWSHDLIEYIFQKFDTTAMTGIGAAMRTLWRKDVKFWTSDTYAASASPVGTELASKLNSTVPFKNMPRETKEDAIGSLAGMFELITACVAYAECYCLLRQHFKFSQSAECTTERAWEGGPGAIGDKKKEDAMKTSLTEFAERLETLGVNPKLLCWDYDDVKKAATKHLAKLPLARLGIEQAKMKDAMKKINKNYSSDLLEGYVLPPNAQKGSDWLATKKHSQSQGKRGSSKKTPKSAATIIDDDDDKQPVATPSKSGKRKRPAAEATPRKKPATGKDGTPLSAWVAALGDAPNKSPSSTPEPATGDGKGDPTEVGSASDLAPVKPFDPSKKVAMYVHVSPVNSGELDDDRGNPYTTDGSVDAANAYLMAIYTELTSGVKGKFTAAVRAVRERQRLYVGGITALEQPQYEFPPVVPKPTTEKKTGGRSKPRRRKDNKGDDDDDYA